VTAPVLPAPALAPVAGFYGQYRFLANPWPCQVAYEDRIYPSAEHAFQAAKNRDRGYREHIAALPAWRDAKRAGRQVQLRHDWERVKRAVMLQVVLDKFLRDPYLGDGLLATGDRVLIEGNNWGDDQWGAVPVTEVLRGTVPGRQLPVWYDGAGSSLLGHNWLGWSLMTVRNVLTEVS
jgi:ribA/ribD-fused uncharacterized protein